MRMYVPRTFSCVVCSFSLFAQVIIDSSLPYLNKIRPTINGANGTSKGFYGSQLLHFSANSPASLARQVDAFKQYTAAHPENNSNVAYTLALRREKLSHRAFAVVQQGKFLEAPSTTTKSLASAPTISMIFSGQGAQWPGMGRELLLSNPLFRQDIIHMDNILQGLRIPPSWSMIGERHPAVQI
jgi:acyl transferase domain-containing protein